MKCCKNTYLFNL